MFINWFWVLHKMISKVFSGMFQLGWNLKNGIKKNSDKKFLEGALYSQE